MNTRPFPSPSNARSCLRGFTLIESLVAIAVAAILSSVAYPSLEAHLLRARRTDALVALMNAQLAQERYRSNHNSYGTLAETGLRNTSASGYYSVQVTANGADGFEVLASATARQARDAACRHLRLVSLGANVTYASGPDTGTSNPAGVNRKCWNQ
ncbi:MAG TPA: type IV pilin protein [Caldimonas sp.]|jgi:type IV pilus assembly protein PilE|nr:type IV pilin protein [Caldimonas sp.]HEX2541966.1 type IV pilin protein [Caldimonas sp.]